MPFGTIESEFPPILLTALQAFEIALVLEDIFINLLFEEIAVHSLLCAKEVLDTLDAEKNATSGLYSPDHPILLQSYLPISWRESSTLHVHRRAITPPFHSDFLLPPLPRLKFI